MQEVLQKLNSDRLWALVTYFAVVVANVKMGLGVPAEQMTELLYAVVTFVVGKSLRGTVGGSMIEALVPMLSKAQPATLTVLDPQTATPLASEREVSPSSDSGESDR